MGDTWSYSRVEQEAEGESALRARVSVVASTGRLKARKVPRLAWASLHNFNRL